MPRDGTDIIFHGVRGTAPAGGEQFSEFGGDTPAVELRTRGARLFLDAGSGLRNARADAGDIDVVLSHYHYDHLIGLPFFEPAWRQSGRLTIWAPMLDGRDPAAVLGTFFARPFCPIGLQDFMMTAEIRPFRPGDAFEVGRDVAVATALADHPGGSAVLRVSTNAGDIVYATDAETAAPREAARLSAFARDADLVIIDSMNGDDNAVHRRGWGHSSWREGVIVGASAGAKSIALFHHDPAADDDRLSRINEEAQLVDARAFIVRQGTKATLNRRGGREDRRRRDDYGDAADTLLSRGR